MAGKLTERRCKQCEARFKQERPLQYVCSWACSIKYNAKLEANKEAKEWREKKKEMKTDLLTHRDYIKILQTVFNSFIRERDKGNLCISCDTPMAGRKGDASHYFATTYQFLRYNEDNVNLSCVPCNQFKHGNFAEYTPRLEAKIGVDRVQWLHAHRHDRFYMTTKEIKEKIKEYKNKIKQLNGKTN